MSQHAVSQVHSSKKVGFITVGKFVYSSKKATDASDNDTDDDREGKQIAWRLFFMNYFFRNLNAN